MESLAVGGVTGLVSCKIYLPTKMLYRNTALLQVCERLVQRLKETFGQIETGRMRDRETGRD